MAKLTSIEIEKAVAKYTGGGVWCFLGKLTNGLYFIAENDFCFLSIVRIVKENPETTDEWDLPEWQEANFLEDYTASETREFFGILMAWLFKHAPNCGINFAILDAERKERDNRELATQIYHRFPHWMLDESVTVDSIEKDIEERPEEIIKALLEM